MSATELLADLARLGIRLQVNGDRLRYSPKPAVTPELFYRLKAPAIDLTDATQVWQSALDRLEGDIAKPQRRQHTEKANVRLSD